MERVAFLIERSGTRIGCLLNPESLLVRRMAGVRPRHSAGGQLTATRLADDPLLYTGGGRTELELDLLFDTGLAGSTITGHDVRELTRPLWELAENHQGDDSYGRPPIVRFVWGKAWNIPGVVEALAERLEQFTPEGAPQRSWMRMRLVRVNLPAASTSVPDASSAPPPPSLTDLQALRDLPPESLGVHQMTGAGESSEPTDMQEPMVAKGVSVGERIDEVATRFYGNPTLWRLVAAFNGIDDPARIAPGLLLQIPPISSIWRTT